MDTVSQLSVDYILDNIYFIVNKDSQSTFNNATTTGKCKHF